MSEHKKEQPQGEPEVMSLEEFQEVLRAVRHEVFSQPLSDQPTEAPTEPPLEQDNA